MAHAPRQCSACPETFIPVAAKQRYCRPQCWHKVARKERKATETCGKCRRAFVPRRDKPNLYCSTKCRREAQEARAVYTTCPGCQGEVRSNPSNLLTYCSEECQDNHREASRERLVCANPDCSSEVISLPGNPRKYCSTPCYRLGRRHRVTAVCQRCKREFTRKVSKAGPFCDERCQRAHQSETQRVTGNCRQCGNLLERKRSLGVNFCDLRCYWKFQQVHEVVTTDCENCGNSFAYSMAEGRVRRYCRRECYEEALDSGIWSGECHPNWRGGYAPYYGPSWTRQREKARRRDRVCQDCGADPVALGRTLDVHHLIPFREFGLTNHQQANDLSNLVSLCKSCHAHREWPTSPYRLAGESRGLQQK